MTLIRTLSVGVISLALAAGFGTAQAQSGYPQKPVRMIIPFAPGGASDFAGRIISPRLSEALGQQIVIDHRAGASGNIGMEAAAKASASRTPEDFAAYVSAESERWGKVARESGATID